MWLRLSKRKKNDYSDFTDEELLTAFSEEEELEILSALYSRYLTQVTGICLKYLRSEDVAKDAVMEIFEELTEKVNRYEIGNFKSWLYTYSRNFCLMQLRRNKKQPESQSIEDSYVEKGEFSHPMMEESDVKENVLPMAIEGLPAEQKQCIELFFFEEKSYQEIEIITGFPLKKVKSYLQNGKRNLKIWYEKNVKEI